MPSNGDIWVVVEHRDGELEGVSLELLCEAHKIADRLTTGLGAVVMGSNITKLVESLAPYDLDKIFLVDTPILAPYSPEPCVEILSNLIQEHAPRIVFGGATIAGRDLFPRLAARLKAGLVSDCVALDMDEAGLLLPTKPAYGGKVYSKLCYLQARPQLATVRPGIMEVSPPDTTRQATVITVAPQPGKKEPLSKIVGFIKGDPAKISLEEADIIVAGGAGVGNASNVRLLEELAEVLGGTVAASRMPVDTGWLPADKQVGQSGKSVAPRLYIACGISGASQHVMGMKNSGTIIAINTDRYAPIFRLADVAIVGDLTQVLPVLTSKLRELVKKTGGPASDDITEVTRHS